MAKKMKGKEWYSIVAPRVFKGKVIGEALITDPSEAVKRTMVINYTQLDGHPSKYYIKIRLRADKVEEGKIKMKYAGHECQRDYIAQMVRKRAMRIDNRVAVETKDKKKLVEQAVYMREPILLRYFGSEIYKVLPQLKLTIPALIGEIFLEEDKEFSARYEGVIRAIASGKRTLTEITQFLHSNSLIPKQDSSLIKPYLKILQSMGIIWRFPEFNVKRHRYFIPSPIIDTYYYLDEKYNFSERELHQKYFEERVPMHVEMFFRTLLAKIFNYRIFLYQKPAEIDIVLGDFRKIKFVGEVKWKSSVDKKDIKKAEEKLAKFRARRVLIVPDKSEISAETKEIEVWDIEDILKMI